MTAAESESDSNYECEYPGDELELFEAAHRWKAYFAAQIAPWIHGDVLEVGAGIGGTTKALAKAPRKSWTCVETDPSLAQKLQQTMAGQMAGQDFECVTGDIRAVAADRRFDAILYIDVLEHIEDDSKEANRAIERLRPGGHLIVLAPAHQWLFSPFDEAVGHFRRYDKKSLRAVDPQGATIVKTFYLDSVGLLASLANRIMLRQSVPTKGQIATWDGWLVPVSRVLDPLLLRRLGKTVVGVWKRNDTP